MSNASVRDFISSVTKFYLCNTVPTLTVVLPKSSDKTEMSTLFDRWEPIELIALCTWRVPFHYAVTGLSITHMRVDLFSYFYGENPERMFFFLSIVVQNKFSRYRGESIAEIIEPSLILLLPSLNFSVVYPLSASRIDPYLRACSTR